MVWSDNTAVAPFYVYDSNGNLIISVTADNGLEVFDPNNIEDKLVIKPGPAGAPTILLYNDGIESYELVATGSQGATQDVKSGTGAGEFHMVERAASTSANFRMGSAESVSDTGVFTNADYLEIKDGGLGTRRVWIQRYGGNYTEDSVPQGELELQPQAGTVTVNGDTAADKITIGAGAITADELDLNPNNGKEVNYNGVPISRRVGSSTRTSDANSGATFTAETLVDTVTVSEAKNGRKYEINWDAHWSSSVASDRITLRIYEEDTGGAGFGNLIRAMFPLRVSHASSSQLAQMRASYTANADESKTFNVTMQRTTGTGNISASASATSPALTTVDEVGT